jgi:hypothetical protein
MSKKNYTSGEVAELLGFSKEFYREQVHRIVKRMGMNPKKDKNGYYIFDDESAELIGMYKDIKNKVKITYKDLKLLVEIIDNDFSKVESIQRTYEILKNYGSTTNYTHTLNLFRVCCYSNLGLSDQDVNLLAEITEDINMYPDENGTLQSMYNYYLYQANVIDTVLNLSKLELELEQEFWNIDVVKGYVTYIFNTVFNRPPITEKIDEFFMCVLMRIKYNTASKNNPLIKKLTLLFKELNKFHEETKIDYEICQHIFLHAIMLLSLDNQITQV